MEATLAKTREDFVYIWVWVCDETQQVYPDYKFKTRDGRREIQVAAPFTPRPVYWTGEGDLAESIPGPSYNAFHRRQFGYPRVIEDGLGDNIRVTPEMGFAMVVREVRKKA